MRAPQRFWRSANSTFPASVVAAILGGCLGLGTLAGCVPAENAANTDEDTASQLEHVQQTVESGSDAKISASSTREEGQASAEISGLRDPDAVRDSNLDDRNLRPKRDHSAVAATQLPSPGAREKTVPVYWVGDTAEGLKLFREFRRARDYGDPIATSVIAAFNGRPLDPDYAHHLPHIDNVGVSLALDNSITLDFPASAFERRYSPELAQMLIQQIVYSATAAAAQASLGTPEDPYRLRIMVDGKPNMRVFSAVELADEYVRDTGAIASVWIIDPQQGQRMDSELVIKGLSTSDADALVWSLYQSSEGEDSWSKIDFGSVSLEQGDSLYSQTYGLRLNLEPGLYRLQVQDPLSTTADSKEFTVGNKD